MANIEQKVFATQKNMDYMQVQQKENKHVNNVNTQFQERKHRDNETLREML